MCFFFPFLDRTSERAPRGKFVIIKAQINFHKWIPEAAGFDSPLQIHSSDVIIVADPTQQQTDFMSSCDAFVLITPPYSQLGFRFFEGKNGIWRTTGQTLQLKIVCKITKSSKTSIKCTFVLISFLTINAWFEYEKGFGHQQFGVKHSQEIQQMMIFI